jgi:RimJ/RimL family protein N-acetyltransferase
MEPIQGEAESPVLSLVGQRVALGPLRRDLVPLYDRWLNDLEVAAPYFNGSLIPGTREAAEERYRQETSSPAITPFTVYARQGPRPIGIANLHDVDHFNRSAMLGLMIGDKASWGRGYGTEATRLLLEYGFVGLGLHTVLLSVFSYNRRAIRAYARAGFREVGRWRQAKRLGGRAYDKVFMDCLASEFQGGALRSLLPEGGEPTG